MAWPFDPHCLDAFRAVTTEARKAEVREEVLAS